LILGNSKWNHLGAQGTSKIQPEGGEELQDCTHFCAPSGISEWWAIYVLNWLVAWKRGELDAFEEKLRWAEE